jgi:hypothetical protein
MSNKKAEIVALRTAIKANPRLEIELMGRISELLRQHNVSASNTVLASLIFALDEELDAGPMVVLPRPTLPPL